MFYKYSLNYFHQHFVKAWPLNESQHKRTLMWTKRLSVRLWTKWLWVRVQLQSHNFRYRACFEQGVPWHLANYRLWIHSETLTLRDNNIQSPIKCVRKVIAFQFARNVIFPGNLVHVRVLMIPWCYCFVKVFII